MTRATTSAPSVATLRRMATAILARAIRAPLAAIFGRARRTKTKARRDVLLLSRREALAAQIAEAKRMHRPVSHLHKKAYSVTHDILRRGA